MTNLPPPPLNGDLDLKAFSVEALQEDLSYSMSPTIAPGTSVNDPAVPAKTNLAVPAWKEGASGIVRHLPLRALDKIGERASVIVTPIMDMFTGRIVTVGLSLLVAFILTVLIFWGAGWVWNYYMVPPTTYSPDRLASYPSADKVVRELMADRFWLIGQAITTGDDKLLDEAITPASPRRNDAHQAIKEWQQYFEKQREFDEPEFAIQVYLVRDVRISPDSKKAEAIADVSTFSSYRIHKRRLETSNDYELWVRLAYKDNSWHLDDYGRVGQIGRLAESAGASPKPSAPGSKPESKTAQSSPSLTMPTSTWLP